MKKTFILLFGAMLMVFIAKSQTTRQYTADQMATLIADLHSAQNGDVFVLTTSGGIYKVDSAYLAVDAKITIKAADGLAKKPIIKMVQGGFASQVDYLIRFTASDVSLTLQGLELQGDSTATKYAIRTAKMGDFGNYSGYSDPNYDKQPIETYDLTIKDCDFNGFKESSYGYAINLYPGTLGRNIEIENSTFSQIERNGIEAYLNTTEIKAHGYWQFVQNLNITNCTFYNIGRAAIEIRTADTASVSGLNKLTINHATFDSCAWNNSDLGKYHTLMIDYVQATITNSIFTDDVSDDYIFRLQNQYTDVDYIGVWNLGNGNGMTDTIQSDGPVNHVFADNPMYTDRLAGNFTLASDSPFLGKASDGHALGDLRWDPDYNPTGIPQTAANDQLLFYSKGSNIYIKAKDNNSLWGEVTLDNLFGQVVYRAALNGTTQQTLRTNLKSGVYIVQLKMDKGTVLAKKVILR